MQAGFHSCLPAERYHADPCAEPSLSNSILQTLLRESPRKAWFEHPRLNQEYQSEEADKFDLGTAAHAMLLEDDRSRIVVVQADDWRTKAAKEQRDGARAEGKTALLERQFDETLVMIAAAREFIAHSEVSELWKNAESEVTGIWREGPLWMRCRFDRIAKNRKVILDYKTTEKVSPDKFHPQMTRMGYHLQESFYRRGARALGAGNPQFVFLAQSVEPPHECALHGSGAALQEIADAEVERGIRLWRDCLTKDTWPSYGAGVHYATPTTWMIRDHEEKLFEEAA